MSRHDHDSLRQIEEAALHQIVTAGRMRLDADAADDVRVHGNDDHERGECAVRPDFRERRRWPISA